MYNVSYNEYIFRETPNGFCTVQEINGDIVAHATVHNNTREALKEVRDIWNELKQLARDRGHEYIYTYNANKRFCDFLGKWEVAGVGYDKEHDKHYEVLEFPLYEGAS